MEGRWLRQCLERVQESEQEGKRRDNSFLLDSYSWILDSLFYKLTTKEVI
jgi:hypothetical protein